MLFPNSFYIFIACLELACLANLIAKRLWWVVDDKRLGEVSAQNVEIFDVVAAHADAVLTEQPVSVG